VDAGNLLQKVEGNIDFMALRDFDITGRGNRFEALLLDHNFVLPGATETENCLFFPTEPAIEPSTSTEASSTFAWIRSVPIASDGGGVSSGEREKEKSGVTPWSTWINSVCAT